MFLLLPCKSAQGWLISDDSHSPEALNGRYQASLKTAQAVCLTDSFSFSGVSFLYLLLYPLCLSLACLPGSSLVVGLGVAAKTKMNILLAASQLPAFSPVRQRSGHLWESHCRRGCRGRELGLSQHLQHVLPSPLCTQLSHEIIIPIYCSHGLHLDIISQYWQICVCLS